MINITVKIKEREPGELVVDFLPGVADKITYLERKELDRLREVITAVRPSSDSKIVHNSEEFAAYVQSKGGKLC